MSGPEQWKDRLIVAQVAAKCAVELLKGREDADSDQFDTWVNIIYSKIIGLVGDPPPVSASSQGPGRAGAVPSGQAGARSGSPQRSGGQDPGTVVIRGGKWNGFTIDQVYNSIDDEGKSGAGWLNWASKELTNGWLRTRVQEYLDRVGHEPF